MATSEPTKIEITQPTNTSRFSMPNWLGSAIISILVLIISGFFKYAMYNLEKEMNRLSKQNDALAKEVEAMKVVDKGHESSIATLLATATRIENSQKEINKTLTETLATLQATLQTLQLDVARISTRTRRTSSNYKLLPKPAPQG